MEELYAESAIGLPGSKPVDPDTETVKTLNITGVLKSFVERLGLDRVHYPTLNPHFS
jgi:hypothetical protein